MEQRSSPGGRGRLALLRDPLLDVAPPEADMSSDAKPGWAFVSVSPCVDGGDGHSQVIGEFLDREKPIEVFHGLSMPPNPLTRVPLPSNLPVICLRPRLFPPVRGQFHRLPRNPDHSVAEHSWWPSWDRVGGFLTL